MPLRAEPPRPVNIPGEQRGKAVIYGPILQGVAQEPLGGGPALERGGEAGRLGDPPTAGELPLGAGWTGEPWGPAQTRVPD